VKRIVVLGSTGSIGRSTLDLIDRHPGSFEVAGLAAARNVDLLAEQAARYRPAAVAIADAALAQELAQRVPPGTEVRAGSAGLDELARLPEADLVVSALVGAAGLPPTWAAIDAGKVVALANKEALVTGGALLTARAAETGALLLPVDSEHNALHQCLRGERLSEVRSLWLTASGGPFLRHPAASLAAVTAEQALRHPTWNMGRKITIDSATLMNKGLEVIEAHWLFGVEPARIRVVVHPQSVIHSMVEFVDGSFKAQLGVTDMRHPIQYALTWPERTTTTLAAFDPVRAGALEFEAPDPDRFPCLPLAFEALRAGGAAPVALNAANEVAVDAFLAGRAGFLDIPRIVRQVLDRHGSEACATLPEIRAIDARARASAAQFLTQGVRT
jgi:1-deoxy-D-xylulose-5-phosphate reductoisomerase